MTSEVTTAYPDICYYSIFLKQVTRLSHWRIVWVFYSSTEKYKYLSIFEQFHICGNFKQRFPFKDTCEDAYNPIFDIIVKYKTAEQNSMVLQSATSLQLTFERCIINIATTRSTVSLHNTLPASGSANSLAYNWLTVIS